MCRNIIHNEKHVHKFSEHVFFHSTTESLSIRTDTHLEALMVVHNNEAFVFILTYRETHWAHLLQWNTVHGPFQLLLDHLNSSIHRTKQGTRILCFAFVHCCEGDEAGWRKNHKDIQVKIHSLLLGHLEIKSQCLQVRCCLSFRCSIGCYHRCRWTSLG